MKALNLMVRYMIFSFIHKNSKKANYSKSGEVLTLSGHVQSATEKLY